MKPLVPPEIVENTPVVIAGPVWLLEHIQNRYQLTKPENKSRFLHNFVQRYFLITRGDGLKDIYYYSKWRLSWWERLRVFCTGNIYVFAILPPPTDFPVQGIPSTFPLEMQVIHEALTNPSS
jgi:hypothetical protein